jgi:hypothetical protein
MSFQVKSSIDSSQPYHVYYNIDVVNNDTTGNVRTPLVFSQNRASSFLNSPSNYYASIVRFSISSNLPVFIPYIVMGQTNPNKTIYKVGIIDKTNSFNPIYHALDNLIYSSNQTDLIPFSATGFETQNLDNDYYYIYSLNQVVQFLNSNIAEYVFQKNPALKAPYFKLDESTQKLRIVFSDDFNDGTFVLVLNEPLYNLLCCFPFAKRNTTFYNETYYELDVQNLFNDIYASTPIQLYSLLGEFSSNSVLNPIQSIVFKIQGVPIIPTFTSPAKAFNTKSELSGNSTAENSDTILTDFELPVSGNNIYRPILYYEPSGPYRLIDLKGSQAIQNLSIGVYWKDIFGNLHNIILNSGMTASLKIMFRRIDYNNVQLNI